ncbi:expressed unknown protein [Seminavis robusta]|uniref:Uncharacterized protein n=1 Tax=Seminavis robusta TaxID=568900 RepID=A0A9N8E1T4_9STRA|nr:expressed unknown protein [Seminavis robusta]|eukprot:Sro460_g147440.1 n/a (272) ;mRNA; r:17879-18773
MAHQAISESVAPVFEQEANRHLTVYFPPCLQGCGVTDFRGREIVHDDTGRVIKQLDSFAYMSNDSLALGSEAKSNGIYLLAPSGMVVKEVVAAPDRNSQDSPGAQDRVPLIPTKYVVGEAYSGANPLKLADKVEQLESAIETLRARHVGRGGACGDITSLVGAALLICSCGSRHRAQAVIEDSGYFLAALNQRNHPHLWRLAQARRLFCIVMSANESPQTVIGRQTHRTLTSLQMDVQGVQSDIQGMQSDIQRLMQHFGLNVKDVGSGAQS